MNKKKTAVLTLLLVVIVVLTSCLLYACNPNGSVSKESETLEPTEGLLIQNGDFKMIDEDATSYPRSLDNWSGSKMYSSSSFRDDVIAGAISLDSALYAANKSAWDDADDALRQALVTGGHGDDNDENKNVLMIYQPKTSKDKNDNDQHGPTAYGYTSASFTLSKGSYYVLSVDVLTYGISGSLEEDGTQKASAEPGARIYVSSNTYAEFAGINTDGAWKTYEIYIETSPTSSTSLTVQLGLGKYTASYSDGLTAGYAFFDNLSLKKLSADVEKDDVANKKDDDPQTTFNKALSAELKFDKAADKKATKAVATTTLKVPNGRFDFGSFNVSSTGVPNSWTHVTGNSGKDSPAPTGLGYNAVIDTTKFKDNYSKYSSSYRTKTSEESPEALYNPAETAFGDDLISRIADSENTDRVGNNVFMLSQQLMTAQGIRSSRSITIEKGKTYALTISLFTVSVRGAGVSLILSGTDGKDIVIEGIAKTEFPGVAFIGNCRLNNPANGYTLGEESTGHTDGAWTDYTFYIKGNDYKDYSYNLSVWLGTDGTDSNHAVTYRNLSQSSNATTYTADGTFSTGWLFIDDLKLNEIDDLPTKDDYISDVDATTNKLNVAGTSYVGARVDLSQTPNPLENFLDASGSSSLPDVQSVGQGAPNGWTSNFDPSDSSNPRIKDFVKEGVVDISDEASFNPELGTTYPKLPYENLHNSDAYAMYASQDSYYEVETGEISLEANKFYRISFWLKTVDVKDTSGAYVYVLNKTAQQKNIDDGKGDDEVILTSITRINTDDYDEYLNDWVEINLVFRGAVKETTNIALKFTLGTGDKWATTTLTSGALYVANFNMADLTYANYTGTSSSTYTKTCDLSTSYTYQFTNGSFDNYDLDDENLDESKNHLYNQSVPATPESWTISDSTLSMNNDDANLYAGVIQLMDDDTPDSPENFRFKSSHQATTATGVPAEFFNNFYGSSDNYYSEENMKSIAGPNVLALGSKDNNAKFAVGFSSTSFTLSANSYNVLSLYAKTYGETTATIRLTGEASGSGDNSKYNHFAIKGTSTDNTGWTKYVFFIKVGKSSVSLKLNLWLGEDVQYAENPEKLEEDVLKESVKSAGHVFFDNISSYTIEDEDKYNEAITAEEDAHAQVNKLDFDVDSFDPLSGSVESRKTLTSPSGWSGAAGTNQSSSNTKSGIIYTGDSNYYDTEALDGTAYVKTLGKDYTEENSDITVSQDEIVEYKDAHPNEELDDYQVRARIVAQKIDELKKNNWIPVSEITGKGAKSGDHMLVINNMTKSAYTYTSASNTLKGNKFYKVSISIRTYGLNNSANDEDFDDIEITDEELAEAKTDPAYANMNMSDEDIKTELRRKKNEIGAYIELYLGSANETGNEFTFKAVASSEWTEYSFYVQTLDDDVTSVTLKLSLGRYINKDVDGKSVTTGLTTGYAMFDDFSVTEVTEDDFNNMKNAVSNPESSSYDAVKAKTNLTRTVTASESGDSEKPGSDTETPRSTFNLEYLWWMIPSIIIGLAIIVVLVVLLVRKIRKVAPKSKAVKIKRSPVSTASEQSLDEKHDRYDSDKD